MSKHMEATDETFILTPSEDEQGNISLILTGISDLMAADTL